MNWLAFALAYLGVTFFVLAMRVHHSAVFDHAADPRQARGFRIGGVALLATALVVITHTLGWQIGLVAWCAMLAACGFVLTQLLAFAPRCAFVPAGCLLVFAFVISEFSRGP